MKPKRRTKRTHQLNPGKDRFIEGHFHPTTRYCIACGKTRVFHYNKFVKHSECIVCGGRHATRPRGDEK